MFMICSQDSLYSIRNSSFCVSFVHNYDTCQSVLLNLALSQVRVQLELRARFFAVCCTLDIAN